MAVGDLGPTTGRILVYGVTGSGKTTLAGQLGAVTGLPWHSVDDLMWEPGWVPVPEDEQRRRVAAICAEPTWILDAAYSSWLDLVLDRVELVVALDYPRWFSLQRLLRRSAVRLVNRAMVCNGNRESLRLLMARDSLLVWHFSSFQRKRDRMRSWIADPDAPTVRRLDSAAATRRWLREVGSTLRSG